MATQYVFVDFENIQPTSIGLLKAADFQARIYLGPKNSKLPRELVLALQPLGERAQYITLDKSGANALDFLIAYDLGRLTAIDNGQASFFIISNDKGYDPLIERLRGEGIRVARATAIADLPGVKHAPAKAAKAVAAAKLPTKAPAKKAARKSARPAAAATDADLLEFAKQHLTSRKTARPSTQKKLLRTLQAAFGSAVPEKRVEKTIAEMVRAGDVIVDGERVSYPDA